MFSNRPITTAWHLLLVSCLGALLYSNSLHAAFQFDDYLNIVDNPAIRDLATFWPPSGPRWFGRLSFAVNYRLGGTDPFGYHLVNTAIHILTACLVYIFVLVIQQTAGSSPRTSAPRTRHLPALACSLLFVAHPIQTQAVTYVVQRFASLATLLFMLSITSYALARQHTSPAAPAAGRTRTTVAVPLYLLSALAGLLAITTKEIAVTLPAVVLLYELLFVSRPVLTARRLIRMAAVLIPAAALSLYAAVHFGAATALNRLSATDEISRHDYFITQLRVIVTYLRLLLFPAGQTIDHHYRVYRTVFSPEIILSILLITALLLAALLLCRLSHTSRPRLRLAAFGIFWFFITLSVESSIIPIADVIFEHRLYLPSIGALLAIVSLADFTLEQPALCRLPMRRYAGCLLAAVIVLFSTATWIRNGVWKDELTLWTDAARKRPDNPRAHNMVGVYYMKQVRMAEAIRSFQRALEADASYAEARSNLGSSYVQIGMLDEGLRELQLAAASNRFDAIDTGILYYNLGKCLYLKGMTDRAIQYYTMAIQLIPNQAAVNHDLGRAYERSNQMQLRDHYLKKAHELDPQHY